MVNAPSDAARVLVYGAHERRRQLELELDPTSTRGIESTNTPDIFGRPSRSE